MKNLTLIIVALFIIGNSSQAQVTFEKNGQQLDRISGRGVALADFNEDGVLDVIFGSSNNYLLHFGDGKGQFTDSQQKLTSSGSPVTCDVNEDGHVDIVFSNTIWMNDGKGNFTSKNGVTGNIGCIRLADLNGDGHKDIFAIVNYAASRVFFNDGAGNFTDSGQRLGDGTIGTGQIAEVALGDINNDGAVDAITAGWRWNESTECPNQVWMNDGKGNFTLGEQNVNEGTSHVHGVAFHDLNGDGWSDLILAIQDASRCGRIYLNDGTGNLIKKANIPSRNGEDVELGDFNGDGIIDLFISQSVQPSRVWLNDGQGNFTDGGARLGNNNYWDTAVGDFNGDGKPDIFAVGYIWGNGNPAPVDIWLNTTVSPTGVKTGMNSAPENYQLFQNYPNPFNPETTIHYSLNKPSSIKLKIFNPLGQEVKTLEDTHQLPGEFSLVWDGKNMNQEYVSSGVYFYQLVVDDFYFMQKRMVFIQ